MSTVTKTKVDPSKLRKVVLGAVRGEIEPVPVSGMYKLGLFIVAAAMLLLPLIYFGMIFLTSYGIFWHAVHNHDWIERSTRGGPGPLGYFLPIIGGPVILVFLVKPLFAGRSGQQQPRRLKREAEPFLYDYVETLCKSVGAPIPRSIRVDCDVNASASFRRGIWSLFSNDLTLTIGLPLVTGCTLRQLSGVLAHEFGHFSQGAGMRLTFVIRTINFWFVRVVYERDRWDDILVRGSQSDIRIAVFFWIARFFVWMTRLLLKGIMYLGHLISCFMLREMEFDADRYEARMVGAETFESTARRIVELSIAHQMAFGDLRQFWDEGRLADDLPRLITANIKHITPEIRKDIKKREEEIETSLFDTHPADRDRIASAYEEETPGVFNLQDAPADLRASVLFSDFRKLSRVISLQLYREMIDEEIKTKVLHPVEQLIERQNAEIEAIKSLHRYFQVRIPPLRPLPIADDADERPDDVKQTADALKLARANMLEALPEYKEMCERYDVVEDRLLDIAGALALLKAKMRIADPAEFGLKRGNMNEATARNRKIRAAMHTVASKLLPFETEAGERLSAALRLLQLNRVAERIEDGDQLRTEVAQLLPEAQFVSGLMSELPSFRFLFRGLVVLVDQLDDHSDNQNLFEAIHDKMQAMRKRLLAVQEQLGNQLYPFDHARADMTLREFALPIIPDEDDLPGLAHAPEEMFDKLVQVQIRLFARLAQAAEKVETALGLPPLPDPEEEEKKQKEKEDKEKQQKAKRRQRERQTA